MNSIIEAEDFSSIPTYLSSLSNASFRTAGYVLGERIMQEVSPVAFWNIFIELNKFDSKAFLLTTLKALISRSGVGDVSFSDSAFKDFLVSIQNRPVDSHKTIKFILPNLSGVQQIEQFFLNLGLKERNEWIPYLLEVSSLPSQFLLFNSLRYVEHDMNFLVRVARVLIRKGDSLSFNVASLMKIYFGLDEIKGTFSLQLRPYELSRIEQSYDAFCKAMQF